MKSERDEKVRDIQGLKSCLSKNESSVENQHQMYLKCQAEIKKMQKDLEILSSEKLTLAALLDENKTEFSQKVQDKEIFIQSLKDEITEKDRQITLQKQIIGAKERDIMAVKAQEYDKVDILKQVGEYESKYTLV